VGQTFLSDRENEHLQATMSTSSVLTDSERSAAATLIAAALEEDLRDVGDLTCRALIEDNEQAEVQVVSRQAGMLAGEPVARMVFETLDSSVAWTTHIQDGSRLEAGNVVATVSGSLASLLTGERTALNFLTHLSGIATVTRDYVDAVAGTQVEILDTRKTLLGYRLLQKYAVRAGGGTNHRLGLFDGVLIKDNHLAGWKAGHASASIAAAVQQARERAPEGLSIEVEVDTLKQLEDALDAPPDIVLLDNMSCETLRRAIALRDRKAPEVQLEASGGVTLETVAEIAATGVERISVGALTHSAPSLDLAFDWPTDS
jgi:nicotinate-nucleotide pyrophosphorylase (carboxylating)